jgi:hypothetical protein
VKRDDLAVRRQSAETDQHADENRHRNRECEDGRKGAEKNEQHCADAAGVADDNVHEANELRNEEYECEDGETEGGVRSDFATDIFVEQAHVREQRF